MSISSYNPRCRLRWPPVPIISFPISSSTHSRLHPALELWLTNYWFLILPRDIPSFMFHNGNKLFLWTMMLPSCLRRWMGTRFLKGCCSAAFLRQVIQYGPAGRALSLTGRIWSPSSNTFLKHLLGGKQVLKKEGVLQTLGHRPLKLRPAHVQ